MASHLLLQLPALALSGWLLARGLPDRGLAAVDRYNDHGIPGILMVSFTGLYWMIPRVLDASLQDPLWAIVKYASLPLLFGAPLALSWPRMHPIARGFVQIELLATLLRFGWLYFVSPIRLCSSYSLTDQVVVGKLLLIIATVIATYWVIVLFTLSPPRETD